jgi:hypothetical protein
VLVEQGQRADALAAYRASEAIRKARAETDPGNAEWQRDVSVSLNKIGDVLVAQGQRGEALAAYRAGEAISKTLAETDPGNTQWQVDLLAVHWRLARWGDDPGQRWGLIVAGLRDLAEAGRLSDYQAGFLPIAEAELAKCDGNATL